MEISPNIKLGAYVMLTFRLHYAYINLTKGTHGSLEIIVLTLALCLHHAYIMLALCLNYAYVMFILCL